MRMRRHRRENGDRDKARVNESDAYAVEGAPAPFFWTDPMGAAKVEPMANRGARYVDRRAIVETPHVGAGTRIWEFVHVLRGARIGRDCNISSHAFVENDVVIGDQVTVKCGVYLWDGVRLEDKVFIGPNATFTNDRHPRSGGAFRLLVTTVREGASIGAAAVIGPGVTIGRYAMVGMGAVVLKDVPDHALVYGNPARRAGWVCFCGAKVERRPRSCRHTGGPASTNVTGKDARAG